MLGACPGFVYIELELCSWALEQLLRSALRFPYFNVSLWYILCYFSLEMLWSFLLYNIYCTLRKSTMKQKRSNFTQVLLDKNNAADLLLSCDFFPLENVLKFAWSLKTENDIKASFQWQFLNYIITNGLGYSSDKTLVWRPQIPSSVISTYERKTIILWLVSDSLTQPRAIMEEGLWSARSVGISVALS